MAVKGAKTKAEMVEKFAKLFGKDWIGEYNGKYYVWAMENGEKLQIAITLTCPKNLVETVSNSAQGKDFDFSDKSFASPDSVAAPVSFTPAEKTQEEMELIDEMMKRLNL